MQGDKKSVFGRRAVASVLLASGVLGGSANATGIVRYGVPDFDQIRDPLPNNGNMYCVPTSAVNWMGYIANHGYSPAMAGVTGPWSQSSGSVYNSVTNRISEMGAFMNTSSTNGTTGGNGLAGLRFYLFLRTGGRFSAYRSHGEVSPNTMGLHMLLGRYVNLCYGYYKPFTVSGQTRYDRDGGHCTTVIGIYEFNTSTPRVRLRNPSEGDSILSQSSFSSLWSETQRQTFRDEDGDLIARWRMLDIGVGSSTRRYIDSMYIIQPLIGLSGGITITRAPALRVIRPFIQDNSLLPAVQDFPLPGGGSVVDTALSPDGLWGAAVRSEISPRLQTVHLVDLATGDVVDITSFTTAPVKVDFNRFGQLVVAADGSVRVYDIDGRVPTLLRTIPMPGTVDDMVCDDELDEIVCVLGGAGRFIRLTGYGQGSAINEPIPSGIAFAGSPKLGIKPGTQQYYLGDTGGDSIFAISPIPGAPRLQINQIINTLGSLGGVKGLSATDGGSLVLLAGDGSVREATQSATNGQWFLSTATLLNGFEGAGDVQMQRSRTNFEPGVHDTPGWRDVLVDEGAQPLPDCLADFNGDGFVNFADAQAFIEAFNLQDPAADLTDDGRLNFADVQAFIQAFTNGC